MIRTLFNWLTLDAQNFITEVWLAALILWIALVVMGLLSVKTNTLTREAKLGWAAAIILLPLAGLFAYCIFCLTRVDYHMLEFLFRKRKSAPRIATDSPTTHSRRPIV